MSGISGPITFGPDGSIFGYRPRPEPHANDLDPIQLWRVVAGTPVKVTGAEPRSMSPVVVSPDGRTLALLNLAQGVDVWRLSAPATATRGLTLVANAETVAAFSADGSLMAIVDRDGAVQIVRIGPGVHGVETVAVISTNQLEAQALGFAADGDLYMSTTTGLYVWPTNPDKIRVQECEVGKMLPESWNVYFPGFDYRTPC